MYLLTRRSDAASKRVDVVIHIGLGLIGRSIQNFLHLKGFVVLKQLRTDWTSGDHTLDNLDSLKNIIEAKFALENINLNIIWSAGKGGFGSAIDDFRVEMKVFKDLCSWVAGIKNARLIRLHYTSSAGGLFEGQKNVKNDSLPDPKRAYGKTKLEQEQIVSIWQVRHAPGFCFCR